MTALVTYNVKHAKLESRVERIESELGDSDRGLRKRVHDDRNLLTMVEGRVERLEEWFEDRRR